MMWLQALDAFFYCLGVAVTSAAAGIVLAVVGVGVAMLFARDA